MRTLLRRFAVCLLICFPVNPSAAADFVGGDCNNDEALDLANALAVLDHLFRNTGPLPAPFPRCGADPSGDALTCAVYPGCTP